MASAINRPVLPCIATWRCIAAVPNASRRRGIRRAQAIVWCAASTLLASATLHGQSNAPPLEPIPLPVPVAKAQQTPAPTMAPRLAPANSQAPGGEAFSRPTEVIGETAAQQAAPANPGPLFRLDGQAAQTITEPTPRGTQPVAPAQIHGSSRAAAGVIPEQGGTAHAYYVTPAPSIQIILPRSRAALRRAYYAGQTFPPASEVPPQPVTVLRPPAIALTLGVPPAGGLFVARPIAPPPPPGVAAAHGVVEAGPPPFVPGQPVRNAIRAMLW